MNTNMILSLLLLVSVLSGCCIQLTKKQTLNQQLGTFVPEHAVYEGTYTIQSNYSTYVNRRAIILFSDGSLVTTLLSEFDDVSKAIKDSKQFKIYRGGSPFYWGKYYINADTIHIEHIVGIAPGGGFCTFRSLRYSGLVKEGHLRIFPGPERIYDKGVTPFIYGKNGAVFEYKGTVTNDLIDPSKAKFRR